MSKINEKFDEIHCILSLDRHDRIKNVHDVFEKYDIQNVRYTYTFNKPIYNNVRESYPLLQTIPYDEAYNGGNKTVYNRVFDCALNHYNIIKSAYKRNVNNLLVFEDDINFVINKNVLDKIIDSIPEDYDVIKFYNNCNELIFEKTNEDNIEFVTGYPGDGEYWGVTMVGFSHRGMGEYVHLVETNGLKPADFHFKEMFLEEKIKIYRMLTYFVTPMLDSYILGNND